MLLTTKTRLSIYIGGFSYSFPDNSPFVERFSYSTNSFKLSVKVKDTGIRICY
jgi:hypothetical protein